MSTSPATSRIVIKPEPKSSNRRTPQEEDEDEEEDEEEVNATTRESKRVKLEHQSTNGKGKQKKRQKVVQDDEEEEEEEEEGEGLDEDGIAATGNGVGAGQKQQLIRDATGYVTGSIVRIACQSFLTYDNVEFNPGPALNMIIGPNGTGKSTIACAIAIGLGFPAKVLGRSPKLSSYCKNDSTAETWIELELKGHPGRKNLIVRRVLSRDSEKTRFHLDGNECKPKEVAERMEDLQVQVGNLCTFLPQDRVASFAQMGHPELLRETEKAAGHVNLNDWHQLLCTEWVNQKEKSTQVDQLTNRLNVRVKKQAEAEKEVQQFEQRKQLEEKKLVVDVLGKYAKYHEVYKNAQDAKADRNRLENEVKELEAKNKPFKDSKELLAMIQQSSASVQSDLEKKVRKASSQADKKLQEVQKNERESAKLSDELKSIKKAEQTRKDAIKQYERTIEKLTPLVENEPEQTNTDEISRRISDKQDERNAKDNSIHEVKSELETIKHEQGRINNQAADANNVLARMQQVNTIREDNAKKWEPDCFAAVQWLRQNKHKLKGRSWEPARFSIFAKTEYNGHRLNVQSDKAMASMIENCISKLAWRTFLFEFQEDYDFFMGELADSGPRLALSAAEFSGKLSDIQRPLTEEQLQQLGFDAFACDLITGPETVVAWLAQEHSLARMPIQIKHRPIDANQMANINAINRYCTRDGSSSSKRSNYGNREIMTESRDLKPAYILSAGVDEVRLKAEQDKLGELKEKYETLTERTKKLRQIGQELYEQAKVLHDEKQELLKEREDMHKVRQSWFKAKTKLESAQSSLKRELAEAKKNTSQKKRDENAREVKKAMAKRVKLTLEYKDYVLEMVELQNAAVKLHLQALQADSDHRAMESLVRGRDEELANKTQELAEMKARLKTLNAEGKLLMKDAEDAIEECSEEIKDRIMERRQNEEPQVQKYLDELDEITANLECMIAISPAVLDSYKKRKTEITDLTRELEEATESLDETKTIIEETRALWLPELRSLIAAVSKRFTAAFDTLGLVGEVRLAEDEDYSKWGIEIMVCFRDRDEDVTLHVLSGRRQSGGERALTTVTYLLALAELARAPFALVDEINQGMDARAERNMHKMLVETTCKDDVGQYFLLTPKLLPDLVYHEKMRVLVINSGSFIPEDLSLESMVKKRKQLNRQKAIAA